MDCLRARKLVPPMCLSFRIYIPPTFSLPVFSYLLSVDSGEKTSNSKKKNLRVAQVTALSLLYAQVTKLRTKIPQAVIAYTYFSNVPVPNTSQTPNCPQFEAMSI